MNPLNHTVVPNSVSSSDEDKLDDSNYRIVLPDECGDSLWDKVLAQDKNLTTILNKPVDTVNDKSDSPTEVHQD